MHVAEELIGDRQQFEWLEIQESSERDRASAWSHPHSTTDPVEFERANQPTTSTPTVDRFSSANRQEREASLEKIRQILETIAEIGVGRASAADVDQLADTGIRKPAIPADY